MTAVKPFPDVAVVAPRRRGGGGCCVGADRRSALSEEEGSVSSSKGLRETGFESFVVARFLSLPLNVVQLFEELAITLGTFRLLR